MCKFVLLATGICGLKIPWIDVPVLLWVQQGGQFSLVRLNFQRVLLPVMVGGATDFLKPFRHCPLITPTQGEEIKPPRSCCCWGSQAEHLPRLCRSLFNPGHCTHWLPKINFFLGDVCLQSLNNVEWKNNQTTVYISCWLISYYKYLLDLVCVSPGSSLFSIGNNILSFPKPCWHYTHWSADLLSCSDHSTFSQEVSMKIVSVTVMNLVWAAKATWTLVCAQKLPCSELPEQLHCTSGVSCIFCYIWGWSSCRNESPGCLLSVLAFCCSCLV